MVKVSVIVPIYNAQKYIRKCVNSTTNQTLEDIEIILINDGSTDKSGEIIEELAKKDERIKIITQPNKGAGAARNAGLDIAKGDYIKFVDADDYLNEDTLQIMYETAVNNDVMLVRGNSRTLTGPFKGIDASNWGKYKGESFRERENGIILLEKEPNFIVKEYPNIGNKLFRRDLIGNIRFPEGKWEDLGIVPALMAAAGKIYHIRDCKTGKNEEPKKITVYNYRVHLNTTINDFIHKIPGVADIIRTLDYLEKVMKNSGLEDRYSNQMESLYILHTLYRVENAMFWLDMQKEQKKEVISLLIYIIKSKFPNWRDNAMVEEYKNAYGLFRFDMNRLDEFITKNPDVASKENAIKGLDTILPPKRKILLPQDAA